MNCELCMSVTDQLLFLFPLSILKKNNAYLPTPSAHPSLPIVSVSWRQALVINNRSFHRPSFIFSVVQIHRLNSASRRSSICMFSLSLPRWQGKKLNKRKLVFILVYMTQEMASIDLGSFEVLFFKNKCLMLVVHSRSELEWVVLGRLLGGSTAI